MEFIVAIRKIRMNHQDAGIEIKTMTPTVDASGALCPGEISDWKGVPTCVMFPEKGEKACGS